MKKLIASLVGALLSVSAMAVDYEVYDVKIGGRVVEEDFDGVRVSSGKLTGWLVYDYDSGASTIIVLEKGYYAQGESSFESYWYDGVVSESDTKATGKGISEMWFEIAIDDIGIVIDGIALGKYSFSVDYVKDTYTWSDSDKGAGSIVFDDYYGGYANKVQFKLNTKLTEGMNASSDPEAYMEDQVSSAVGYYASLSWSWLDSIPE